MNAPIRRSIYRQFAQHLFTPLIAVLFLATVSVILVSYHNQVDSSRRQRQELMNAYANSLLKPLWDCDDQAAKGIADSILQLSSIQSVTVLNSCTGSVVDSSEVADASLNAAEHLHKELIYLDPMKRQFTVGKLDVFFYNSSVFTEAFDVLWPYLLIISAMAMAMALGSMLAFRIIISQPLTAFRGAINARIPARDCEDLIITLPLSKRNDELTDVVKAYDVLMDILAEQKQKLRQQARMDPLTGLGNRIVMEEVLRMSLERAKRNGGKGYVLLIDLDEFKPINDKLGHSAGDYVLQNVAQRLQSVSRSIDTVVRMGGDEFVVVIDAQSPPEYLPRILEKLLQALTAPLDYEGTTINVKASVGVVCFPDDGADSETLLAQADLAMYADKATKKFSR